MAFSLTSAPASQTLFSLSLSIPTTPRAIALCDRLYKPSNLATKHSVIVEADEHDSDDPAPLIRSTSAPSLPGTVPAIPTGPSQSPSATRSRAMGNLTEALERRRAKENRNPQLAQISPRHNNKALGLQAAVTNYKMKKLAPLLNQNQVTIGSELCSSPTCSADPSSPNNDQATNPSTPTPANYTEPPQQINTHTTPSPESPRLMHSQYLAARRQSIMQRVGGHRRVVSDTKAYVPSSTEPVNSHVPHKTSPPVVGTLPSLDQIRSWAALRKNSSSHADKSDQMIDPNGLWANDYSKGITGLVNKTTSPTISIGSNNLSNSSSSTGRKSKSLPIFAHARDPSIPRICLSPDSDDEEDDIEGEVQSESPSQIVVQQPTILIEPPTTTIEMNQDNRKYHQNASISLPSSPKRAEQRQALLANLALARNRRSTSSSNTTSPSATSSSPSLQIVPPV